MGTGREEGVLGMEESAHTGRSLVEPPVELLLLLHTSCTLPERGDRGTSSIDAMTSSWELQRKQYGGKALIPQEISAKGSPGVLDSGYFFVSGDYFREMQLKCLQHEATCASPAARCPLRFRRGERGEGEKYGASASWRKGREGNSRLSRG